MSEIGIEGQYLTFLLESENYALNILNVKEVIEARDITRIPRMPDYMLGVINLRGSIVPVIDLRLKFGLPQKEETIDTCIIIIEMTLDKEMLQIGLYVDSVKEVIDLEPDQIESPPKIGIRLKSEFLQGIGKKDGAFIILLNIGKIFTEQELDSLISADVVPDQI